MDMKVDTKILKYERNRRAWSQQHLSEAADLSLRTIQRIETTGLASPESIKSIASAFNVTVEELLVKEPMLNKFPLSVKSIAASLAAILPIAYLSLSLMNSNDLSAEPTIYTFIGGVRVDENLGHQFRIPLKSKQVFTIQIDDNHQLLLITPGENDENPETEIRLLQRERDAYDILHVARTKGSSSFERSISYRVCGDDVTFYTPKKDKIPLC